jgi:hypothetical protein
MQPAPLRFGTDDEMEEGDSGDSGDQSDASRVTHRLGSHALSGGAGGGMTPSQSLVMVARAKSVKKWRTKVSSSGGMSGGMSGGGSFGGSSSGGKSMQADAAGTGTGTGTGTGAGAEASKRKKTSMHRPTRVDLGESFSQSGQV